METLGSLEISEGELQIKDAIESAAENPGDRTATGDAAAWLADFVTSQGGSVESAKAKREGAQAGHSADALKRARKVLRLISTSFDYPRRTVWTHQ